MTAEEPDRLPDEAIDLPDPTPHFAARQGERGRKLPVGLAPAGVILPLAVVGLIIWLLASGRLNQAGISSQATRTLPVVIATPTSSAAAKSPEKATPAEPFSQEEFIDRLAQARTFVDQSKFDDAIALYQDLTRQAPDDARPEVGWAWALILDGQADQALPHAYRAVELDPTSAETMAVLARAFVETGDRSRALGMAENAVQLNANSAEARAVLAEAYLLNSQQQAAVDEAELALAKDAASAEAHRIRGRLYDLVDRNLEAAAQELQLAAALQPALWLRHHELGLVSIKAKDYAGAVAELSKAMALRPQAVTYSALGEAYYRLGDNQRARSFLDQALAAGLRDADTYALLAMTDAQEGRCDAARLHFDRALAQEPSHQLALQARNICLGSNSSPAPTATEPTPPPSSPPLAGKIAFPVWSLDEGRYDIYLSNPDGSERHLVAEGIHQPAFSPDGQWLAANGERPGQMNLLIVRPDGSEMQQISEHIEDGLAYWAPNGQALVFSSTRHSDRRSRLYIMDQVPFTGERVQVRPLNSDLYEVLGEYPAWTPDGQIVYNGCDYTASPAQCGLFILSSEPGPQTPEPLTTHPEDTAPAAHGPYVVFMSNRDGNWEIYLTNRDGSELKRLTDNTANDGLPAWSPDGKTIAFVSDEGGIWAVWAIERDGSNRRKLFDLGAGGLAVDWQHERISWGP